MATASFTWAAWDTTNAWQNLADAANNANLAYAKDTTDGAAKFTTSTKSATMTEYGRKSGNGDTWASIFGIASGATITAVQLTAWKRKLVTNTKITSNSLTVKLISDAAATLATLINAGATSTSTDANYTAQTAGTNQTGLSISAADNVRLSLEYTVVTGGTGGSAAIDCRWDDFEVTITYTPPATTHTSSSNLNAMIQKTGITKTANLNAMVEKQGLTKTANLNSMIRRQGLTAAANLNALIQKLRTEYANLNALLQKERTGAANLGALIQKADIAITANLNAILVKVYESTALLDALIEGTAMSETDLDALLEKQGVLKAASLNALIAIGGIEIAAGLDAYVASLNTLSASLNALIQKQDVAIASGLDSLIAQSVIVSASLNGLIQRADILKTAGLDSLVKKLDIERAAGLDAILSGISGSIANLDALLQKAIEVSSGLDALVMKQRTETLNLDALLQKGFVKSADIDALIAKGFLTTSGLDAMVRKEGVPVYSGMDGMIAAVSLASVSLDAILVDIAFRQTYGLGANVYIDGDFLR